MRNIMHHEALHLACTVVVYFPYNPAVYITKMLYYAQAGRIANSIIVYCIIETIEPHSPRITVHCKPVNDC